MSKATFQLFLSPQLLLFSFESLRLLYCLLNLVLPKTTTKKFSASLEAIITSILSQENRLSQEQKVRTNVKKTITTKLSIHKTHFHGSWMLVMSSWVNELLFLNKHVNKMENNNTHVISTNESEIRQHKCDVVSKKGVYKQRSETRLEKCEKKLELKRTKNYSK